MQSQSDIQNNLEGVWKVESYREFTMKLDPSLHFQREKKIILKNLANGSLFSGMEVCSYYSLYSETHQLFFTIFPSATDGNAMQILTDALNKYPGMNKLQISGAKDVIYIYVEGIQIPIFVDNLGKVGNIRGFREKETIVPLSLRRALSKLLGNISELQDHYQDVAHPTLLLRENKELREQLKKYREAYEQMQKENEHLQKQLMKITNTRSGVANFTIASSTRSVASQTDRETMDVENDGQTTLLFGKKVRSE